MKFRVFFCLKASLIAESELERALLKLSESFLLGFNENCFGIQRSWIVLMDVLSCLLHGVLVFVWDLGVVAGANKIVGDCLLFFRASLEFTSNTFLQPDTHYYMSSEQDFLISKREPFMRLNLLKIKDGNLSVSNARGAPADPLLHATQPYSSDVKLCIRKINPLS